MEVAGNPSVSKIALTCLGGYLSAGGAGAVNHYYDRDIDARMSRTATRPIPAGRVSPRAALIFGFALAALSFLLLSLTVNLLAASLALARVRGLRRRLHDLAQAPHAPEHRDRRRRRRRPAAGRLGRDPRLAVVDGGLPVRDRLLLDTPALLGAQPADEGRVRQGRHPDDAGRPRRAARPAARSCSTRCCCTRSPSCPSARARSAASTSSRRSCSGWPSSPARCGSTGGRTAAPRCSFTSSRWSTWRCCLARWWPT